MCGSLLFGESRIPWHSLPACSLPVGDWQGCFQFFAVVNQVAMNTCEDRCLLESPLGEQWNHVCDSRRKQFPEWWCGAEHVAALPPGQHLALAAFNLSCVGGYVVLSCCGLV